MGRKGDEIDVESSGFVQMESISPMLEVALLISTSSLNSSKGASSKYGLTDVSPPDQESEPFSIELASLQEVLPISNPVH